MMSNLALFAESPALLAQLVLNGVLVGAIFALVAYGMALVWGVMNVINVAQGELVMLGGYVVLALTRAGVSPLAAIPVSAAILYLVGWALYRTVVFRVVERDLFTSLLATFGVSILLQQLMNQVFGADIQSVDAGLGSYFLASGAVTIAKVNVLGFCAALAVGAGLVQYLRATRRGMAIRATAQNARAARVLGIDVQRVYAQTFALNAALCGAAGGLVAMTWVIHPYLGLTYTLRSFMIVIAAGLGNVGGVLLAGTGLGVAENLAGFVFGAEYETALVFAMLVLIIVARNLFLVRQRRYLV